MEEKIIICPYCGASVPKNWKFCPKCAHILTGEPVITVLTPPPDSTRPDWTDSLLEVVEVSYLEESDLEPLSKQTSSSGSEAEKISEADRTAPVKEGIGPSTDQIAGADAQGESFKIPLQKKGASGETNAKQKKNIDEPSTMDSEPSLAEAPSLLEKKDELSNGKKRWLKAFSHLKPYFLQRTDRQKKGKRIPEQKTPPIEGAVLPPHKTHNRIVPFKKLLPFRSSSGRSLNQSASPGVRISNAVKKGLKWLKHRTKVVPPPIYLAVERKRNRRTALAVLCIVLLLGGGAPFALWQANIKALEASLELGWSRNEVHERTPYTLALRFADGVVETYQKSPFYRNEYVLSQKRYTVTSPETVEIDGKEYHISFSENQRVITMSPAFSHYGEKEVWYRQDSQT